MKALVNNQNNVLVFEGFHKYLVKKKLMIIKNINNFIYCIVLLLYFFLNLHYQTLRIVNIMKIFVIN